MLRAIWILFTVHLGRTLLSRRALICAGIAALPVGVSFLVAQVSRFEGPPPALEIGHVLILQTCVPLISILLGSAVVAEEIEDRTITYVLARPIPRASILLGRWLASLVILSLILGASSAASISLLGAAASPDPDQALPEGYARRLVLVVLAGGAVYSALFAAIGAWLKRPILVGIGYIVAIEGFLANLPGSGQALTVQFYLKSCLFGGEQNLAERLRESFLTTELDTPWEGARGLALITFFSLAFGSWILSRRQFLLPS